MAQVQGQPKPEMALRMPAFATRSIARALKVNVLLSEVGLKGSGNAGVGGGT